MGKLDYKGVAARNFVVTARNETLYTESGRYSPDRDGKQNLDLECEMY
jgi:hypothetical protein